MAENFRNSQNLDDGELWKLLPSVDQQGSFLKLNDPRPNSYFHHQQFPCMALEDLLVQRFDAFSLTEQSFYSPLPTSESFRIASFPQRPFGEAVLQRMSVGSSGPGRSVCYGGGAHDIRGKCISGDFCAITAPVFPRDFVIGPFRTQGFLEESVAASQNLQKRVVPSRVTGNRILAFPGWRNGNDGGLARDYGGTGVFLPRTPVDISSTSTPTTNRAHARKRQSRVRNRNGSDQTEGQLLPKRNFANAVINMDLKQEDCPSLQVPPELCLPKDWTY